MLLFLFLLKILSYITLLNAMKIKSVVTQNYINSFSSPQSIIIQVQTNRRRGEERRRGDIYPYYIFIAHIHSA